jgi:hypothetical protein
MADIGIKKAVVLSDNLPESPTLPEEYLVRYRIVSEDRNRRSHWSPIYYLNKVFTQGEES